MDRLLTAYQEGLISLDELRERMPNLRRREQADNSELQAIADQSVNRAAYLRIAQSLTTFLARLRASAEALDVSERQRILRLLVKEILVGDDKIIIQHSIPLPIGGDGPSAQGAKAAVPNRPSYLLRPGSPLASARKSVPAPRIRHVDAAGVPAHPIRAIRGRRHLSLQERRRGAGTLECDCRPLRGLQAGAASREDEDRLLQGCEPARRLPNIRFDFLGFQFRARKIMWVKADRRIFAHSFQPAASPKAPTRISREIRSWALHHRSDKSLAELALMYNPCIRGWISYYSHFYKMQLRPTLKRIDA